MSGRGGSAGPNAGSKRKGTYASSVAPSRSSDSQDVRNDSGKPRSGSGSTPNAPKAKKPDVSHGGAQGNPLALSEFPPMKDNGHYMHDRTLWLLMHLVGKVVEVQVKSGERFEGVFYTATTEKGLGILLKMARRKDKDAAKDKSRPIENFIIYPADFVQLYAKEVPLDIRNEREFGTDTEISAHGGFRERELQPWIPDENVPHQDLSLSNSREDWDQFATNRDKFGVETSWDERYYTTEINKNSTDYKQRSREAERIAAEIERNSRSSNNFHVIEERGFEVDIGEEERYGAVIRQAVTTPSKNADGKYVPPQRRSQEVSKPGNEKETVPQKDEKQKNENDDKSKPSPKDVRKSDPSIQRMGSSDENGEPKSPRSPNLTGSPRLMKGDTQTMIQERLRLRSQLTNEKFKNSKPVTSTQQNEFSTPNRSPLLSPLIGDARSINALSLEPHTPNLPEDVINEFFNFSLTAQKKTQDKGSFRERDLAALKSFSKNIEKKIPSKGEGESPRNSPRESSNAKEESAPESAPKPAETGPTPAKEAPATEDKPKTKLNPNAKVFKPMSASAPSFVPSAPVAPVPMMVPTQEWYQGQVDPYFAYGAPRQPVYPVPFAQPMMPNQQVVFAGPGPVRIVPQVYPGGQYPYGQPMVYGAPPPGSQPVASPPNAQQGGPNKRFVPTGNAPQGKGPASGPQVSSSPPQFQGGFVPGHPPHAAFFPNQYGQPQMLVAQPIEGYQPRQGFYPPEQSPSKEDGSDQK
eukprot:TRINITY_DN4916_c1_g1_i1.p1 TRINITY_DN4916_c1_g1~~TRINITY_DN4916_c1_g1_i1.p1  ORF type:complete len:750 (-),score=197.97 TRINITY_DN4916_c1_g1_i1:36-2285(-)